MVSTASSHAAEVAEGARFEFGANWARFLDHVDEARVERAERELAAMLGVERLDGATFLDVGSGSGLSSLAARRMGARVRSFDYDPASVACTRELKRRLRPDDTGWTVERGSVLDTSFMERLGTFDVVYSWGVLHHTGDQRAAIDHTVGRVRPGGILFLALYNDQGGTSQRWLAVKRAYNRLPRPLRPVLVVFIAAAFEARYAVARAVRRRSPLPFADWRARSARGMSVWHDWVDWIGGLPFEVSKPEEIVVPLGAKGFVLENLRTVGGGHGCNEYVFRRA